MSRTPVAKRPSTLGPSTFKDETLPHAGRAPLLGNVLLNAGRVDDARRTLESALITFRASGDTNGEARTLENLGLALARAGDRQTALDALKLSARLLEPLGDPAASRNFAR